VGGAFFCGGIFIVGGKGGVGRFRQAGQFMSSFAYAVGDPLPLVWLVLCLH
jgi:hypothetical protein